MSKAFLQCNQTSYSSVSILERMYILELCMEGYDIFYCDIFLCIILIYQCFHMFMNF